MFEWMTENVNYVNKLTKLVKNRFDVKYKRIVVENLLITDVHNR
jgi:hypothetical protein